jgi:hypothetical protein
MDISNEELFNSALNDEPIAEPAADAPAEQESGQPRDEHGRFAPKSEEQPEPKAEVKPEAREDAQIPSWRLREIREERDMLRQQLAEIQRGLAARQPQQEKPVKPDLFEKPDEAIRYGAQELVDPVKQEMSAMREEFSKMYAVDKYGEEKVTEAFSNLDRAAKMGDPEAVAVVQRVKQSMTPYQDIMKWHEKQSVYSQIGNDPNAWFEKQLEERLAKDEAFKASIAAKLAPEKPRPVVNLPPSLNRAAAAQAALEEGGDLSNESLFAFARS